MATQKKDKSSPPPAKAVRVGRGRHNKAWKQGKTPEERESIAQRKREAKAIARYSSGVKRLILLQERIDARRIARAHNKQAETARTIKIRQLADEVERSAREDRKFDAESILSFGI